MEDRFEAITEDGSWFLNEDYLMYIFSLIAKRVDPFACNHRSCLQKKLSMPIVKCLFDEDKVLTYNELHAELFYPSCIDIRQTDTLVICLA